MPDEMRNRRTGRRDHHAGLPAEEQRPGNCEDEAERDAAGVHALDRHGETLGD